MTHCNTLLPALAKGVTLAGFMPFCVAHGRVKPLGMLPTPATRR